MHSAISNHFAEYIQDYEPFKMNLVVPCSVIVHLPKKMGASHHGKPVWVETLGPWSSHRSNGPMDIPPFWRKKRTQRGSCCHKLV